VGLELQMLWRRGQLEQAELGVLHFGAVVDHQIMARTLRRELMVLVVVAVELALKMEVQVALVW
jgi:methyl coenzyme M reductase subunit C